MYCNLPPHARRTVALHKLLTKPRRRYTQLDIVVDLIIRNPNIGLETIVFSRFHTDDSSREHEAGMVVVGVVDIVAMISCPGLKSRDLASQEPGVSSQVPATKLPALEATIAESLDANALSWHGNLADRMGACFAGHGFTADIGGS